MPPECGYEYLLPEPKVCPYTGTGAVTLGLSNISLLVSISCYSLLQGLDIKGFTLLTKPRWMCRVHGKRYPQSQDNSF